MANFRRGTRLVRDEFARALNVRADIFRTEIFGVLEENRVGRGPNPGPVNQRSAPGDPPARQTGRLQESIAVTKKATPLSLVAEIGPRPQAFTSTAPYPVFLEFGTVKMAPRPFMRPGIRRAIRKIR